jgi:hypothetical protein
MGRVMPPPRPSLRRCRRDAERSAVRPRSLAQCTTMVGGSRLARYRDSRILSRWRAASGESACVPGTFAVNARSSANCAMMAASAPPTSSTVWIEFRKSSMSICMMAFALPTGCPHWPAPNKASTELQVRVDKHRTINRPRGRTGRKGASLALPLRGFRVALAPGTTARPDGWGQRGRDAQ